MKVLWRALIGLLGFLVNLAGLAGGSDQVANWSHWLSVTHGFLENPAIWLTASFIGIALMALAWGDYRAEQIISKAGGPSKKEFPANFSNWDAIWTFTVWQIAWLWTELEPYDPETRQTRAYPQLR
jgi:hypothetical protein